ncbi:DUF58 domain-containing protein [Actinocrispum sp. NPDC049592]|uniref:DUF58 domain-containing protein n=1 Tax=Actinocrispum sp. NPDC049592 TaxID=3154835 RepID=UPI00342F37CD
MSLPTIKWASKRGDERQWRNTDAMFRAVVGGAGLVVAGVLAHSLVLVVFGVPLLVSAALATRKLDREPTVSVPQSVGTVGSGQGVEVKFDIEADPDAELVALRAPRPGTLGVGRVHLMPAKIGEVRTELRHAGWGDSVALRPDYLFAGPDGLQVHGPHLSVELWRRVLPPVSLLPAGPLSPRPSGLVGVHRSPRPGDSTELRDIRPFHSGDQLKRIDWRVSLRASAATGVLTPHVREYHADADATLILAIDTRVDVGPNIGEWSLAVLGTAVRPDGSLDTAVRAATALGASYLRQGDRVGLVDLGRPHLSLQPGSGTRQLLRLRHQLVTCSRAVGYASKPILRPQQAPSGALVIVFSPFLDDAVIDLTATVVRRGTRVLAMDLLPERLVPAAREPYGRAVLEVLRAEHAVRLETLRQHGIPVMRWGGQVPGMLRSLARGRRR